MADKLAKFNTNNPHHISMHTNIYDFHLCTPRYLHNTPTPPSSCTSNPSHNRNTFVNHDHYPTLVFLRIKIAQQSTSSLPHLRLLVGNIVMHICTNHTNCDTKKYMSNQRKNTVWPTKFPSPLCNLCPLQEANTCSHLLSVCTNPDINNTQTTRHIKGVWHVRKLFLFHSTTCDTLLMNS